MATFTATNSRRLVDAGLRGKTAAVTYDNGALAFVGEAGGGVKLSAAMVDRMRVGFEEGKSVTIYQTVIWPKGEKTPIMIYPDRSVSGWHLGYNAAIRAYARALAQAHGIGRVERGVSPVSALVNLILCTLPAAAYTAVAFSIAERKDWLGWLGGGTFLWAFRRLRLALCHAAKATPGEGPGRTRTSVAETRRRLGLSRWRCPEPPCRGETLRQA